MLLSWWFMRLFDKRHRAALLAFQFSADPFSLRAQRLATHLNTGQIRLTAWLPRGTW